MGIEFVKMHGLGNDFAIFDGRKQDLSILTPEYITKISNRKTGIGCDQIILLEKIADDNIDAFMRIYNPDGSEVEACGNATRCVGKLLCADLNKDEISLQTIVGNLKVQKQQDDQYKVNMGKPKFNWQDIPLSEEQDTLNLALPLQDLVQQAVAVNVGNPHVVFFVDDVEKVPLEEWGPAIENHAMFPSKTNVEFVEVLSPEKLRMRVWERGTGVTMACGSGSCASLVAAVRAGKSAKKADIILDGGTLSISWDGDGADIFMIGPAVEVYRGTLP